MEACKHESIANEIDSKLFKLAKEQASFAWYKFNSNLLPKSQESGHPQEFLRTRYNSIASSQLNEDGEIFSGAIFPEGSLIVKELYRPGGSLDQFAIQFKDSGSEFADACGWIWGYLKPNGKTVISATEKGASCIRCHSQDDNIDYMLMDKYFD